MRLKSVLKLNSGALQINPQSFNNTASPGSPHRGFIPIQTHLAKGEFDAKIFIPWLTQIRNKTQSQMRAQEPNKSRGLSIQLHLTLKKIEQSPFTLHHHCMEQMNG